MHDSNCLQQIDYVGILRSEFWQHVETDAGRIIFSLQAIVLPASPRSQWRN